MLKLCIMNTIELQSVICIKDNKLYAYKVEENPYFLEENYGLIRCFPVSKNGDPDFLTLIEIYGKDLVSADHDDLDPALIILPY
jgi:hypothetical protein